MNIFHIIFNSKNDFKIISEYYLRNLIIFIFNISNLPSKPKSKLINFYLNLTLTSVCLTHLAFLTATCTLFSTFPNISYYILI